MKSRFLESNTSAFRNEAYKRSLHSVHSSLVDSFLDSESQYTAHNEIQRASRKLPEEPFLEADRSFASNVQASILLTGNQQSPELTKELPRPSPNRVLTRGQFPKHIKKSIFQNVIDLVNRRILVEWDKMKEIDTRNIDVNQYFKTDPDEKEFDLVYSVFVFALKVDDLKTVWNALRTVADETLNKLKREFPKFRKKIEVLEKHLVIHIEW